MESVGTGADVDDNAGSVRGWFLVRVLSSVKAAARQLIAVGGVQLEIGTISSLQKWENGTKNVKNALGFFAITFKVWVLGSKSRVPAKVRAAVISGLVTNPWVAGLASFLPVKFLLYEVTIVFFSPFFTLVLSHWPMQGPHALARTMPPNSRIVSARPSRSIVARICSLPGVM